MYVLYIHAKNILYRLNNITNTLSTYEYRKTLMRTSEIRSLSLAPARVVPVCVCVCVCVCVYGCDCTHARICVCVHTPSTPTQRDTDTDTCLRAHWCMHVCTSVWMHAFTFTYVCMHACMHVCVYTCVCTYIYTCACMNARIKETREESESEVLCLYTMPIYYTLVLTSLSGLLNPTIPATSIALESLASRRTMHSPRRETNPGIPC